MGGGDSGGDEANLGGEVSTVRFLTAADKAAKKPAQKKQHSKCQAAKARTAGEV